MVQNVRAKDVYMQSALLCGSRKYPYPHHGGNWKIFEIIHIIIIKIKINEKQNFILENTVEPPCATTSC